MKLNGPFSISYALAGTLMQGLEPHRFLKSGIRTAFGRLLFQLSLAWHSSTLLRHHS